MSLESIYQSNEIIFFLQDEEHIVKTEEVSPETSLNSYIRNHLNLKGTKFMCYEGGCGACIVVVKGPSPVTQKEVTLAVNSCLVSILSCHGWRIYTVEGIGDPLTKYHPIQEVLVNFNGTQCGFCSSGIIMNMYALYESKGSNLTMKDVEDSFGGNICRCTGYRPILSAFKSLCKDADANLLGQYPDIEDFQICHTEKKCTIKSCNFESEPKPFFCIFTTSKWIKIFNLKDLLNTLKQYNPSKYMLVAGNTAKGVFKSYNTTYDVYIDISAVSELHSQTVKNDTLILGANTTLTNTIDLFNKISTQNPNFSYLKKLADHIDLIANVPVRNIGSLAGNLMMKHDHNDFPSDIFLIMETVGCLLTIVDINGIETVKAPRDFIKLDMKEKVLKNIIFSGLNTDFKFESYKIMPRAQNAHAIVNAGFLFKFNNEKVAEATIVYGNIDASFVHAIQAERSLINKNLFDDTTLKNTYKILNEEINPCNSPPDPSPEMRKQLAISLFYKAVLSLVPVNQISVKKKSGSTKLERPISSAAQDYETNKSLYPLTEPIPKIEALAQTSGQAQYIGDMPDLPKQLFASFVLAKAPPNSLIKKIDPSKALALDNIVAFYSKNDIPGDNNFMPPELFPHVEEIFCSEKVLYYHQPIGLLVGKNELTVTEAVDLVQVIFDPSKQAPVIGVREIIKAERKDKIFEEMSIIPKRKGTDIKHTIKGTFDIYEQYHFHMETQSCNVIPNESGFDVYPSSQWMDLTQIAIANMLKLPHNLINVHIRRCGGAFGAKISRNTLIACAAALASWKLKKPVKLSMSLQTNMEVIGKRFPFSGDYEIAVNDKGAIQYLNATLYTDLGCCSNENAIFAIVDLFTSNYDSDTFSVHVNSTRSDTYANTWTRAPGSAEGLAFIEAIMEHVAYEINMDPTEFRKVNITKEKELLKYISDIYEWAEIPKRKQEISKFNKENRWKKKGLSVVPMAYKFEVAGPFPVMVTIYHGDGSVSISHGGIEVGQGINTKAAQTCAYKFSIPLEKVSVIPSNNFVSPNATMTGGSVTSEAICYGVETACDILLERMAPYKNNLKSESWQELVEKSFKDFVNLSAIALYSPKAPGVKGYTIYGVCATEVLLDVLTGQHLITRVDLIEDVGRAINPIIDIGQVEGAFIMGMGYYTSEKIVYDSNGRVLTNNTWTYKPPTAKDIPIDFRVKFPKNNENPVGVLKSKATAEPPLCMTVSIPLAIRNAVASARIDADNTKPHWYPFDGASTVENTFLSCLNDFNQYTL